ncbi:MAG: copper chaperone CopZ [Solibacillus sp.]
MMSETLKVAGMSCGHCVNAVESNVGKLQGVSSVTVNLADGEVTVEYDSKKISLDEIKDTIEEQGYDVA